MTVLSDTMSIARVSTQVRMIKLRRIVTFFKEASGDKSEAGAKAAGFASQLGSSDVL